MDRTEPTARRRRGLSVATHDEHLAAVRRRLLQQAFVFDDPAAYAAGVEDAFAAMTELSVDRDPDGRQVDRRGARQRRAVPVQGAAR